MKECDECEYRGYSRQLCMLHNRNCKATQGQQHRPLPASLKIGATTLAGAGVGVAAVILGTTAVSLVGGVALIHAIAFKLGAGAGLAGGGIGLLKGLRENGKRDENVTPRGDR